jgi:hypothetical protein
MITNQNSDPKLQEFEKRLDEFKRKIDEDDYDSSSDGFYDEFNGLKNDLQELFQFISSKERLIVVGFKKRLVKISREQDMYNGDGELEMMFPDGED